MNPNDHSATRKIHKCNFYIDKTRATIYSLQCPTEANEKFQSSLIHITWNWIPPHLKFSNRPSIFHASTPKLVSALRLLTRTCPFLALVKNAVLWLPFFCDSVTLQNLGSLCHSIEVQKICLCLHKLNKVLNKHVAGWRRRDRARGRGLTHRSSLEPRSASSVTATAMQHPRPLWRRGGRTSSAAHPPHSHTSLVNIFQRLWSMMDCFCPFFQSLKQFPICSKCPLTRICGGSLPFSICNKCPSIRIY